MKKIIIAVAVTLLSGCAAQNYATYAKSNADIEIAKHNAEAEKYRAMSAIAAVGDSTAKVAAVMAMAMGSQMQPQSAVLQPPRDEALQWFSILLPSVTQMYGISRNAAVAMNQSNNAAAVAASTNATFLGMAGQIQAPTAPQANYSYNISGNSGANSGNSGKLAGGDVNDNTATPTVVTQPAPVIVTQPAPVIVNPVVVNTTPTVP